MAQDTYAPPKSNLTPSSSTDIDELLPPLMETKPWVRLCSILGFIFTAFILLGALGILAAGSRVTGPLASMGSGVAVLYILMAVFYFVPSLYLFKYASAIATANETRNTNDITRALGTQKSFWKFVGIVAAISLILMVIGIVFAIALPMMVS